MRRIWYRVLAILAAAGGMAVWFLIPGRSYAQQSEEATQPTQQTETSAQIGALTFPYTIPESGLVVEAVLSYSGTYMEDGTDDVASDITSLMLYNPTERMVRFGAFALEQNGKQLYFFVYCLPPNSKCLILEKNRHTYMQQPITQCRQLNVRWDYQDMHSQELHVVGFGETLTVVNLSQKRQRHVTLWYKQYDREGAYFLGGVAFPVYAFRLKAQEQRSMTPEYYDAGNARVVSVELEE